MVSSAWRTSLLTSSAFPAPDPDGHTATAAGHDPGCPISQTLLLEQYLQTLLHFRASPNATNISLRLHGRYSRFGALSHAPTRDSSRGEVLRLLECDHSARLFCHIHCQSGRGHVILKLVERMWDFASTAHICLPMRSRL